MSTPDQAINKVINTENNWRTGMWVVYQDKIAILNAFKLPNVEIHFVNKEDGTTSLIDFVPLSTIRQAGYYEIPACRRVNFSLEAARRLGYGA